MSISLKKVKSGVYTYGQYTVRKNQNDWIVFYNSGIDSITEAICDTLKECRDFIYKETHVPNNVKSINSKVERPSSSHSASVKRLNRSMLAADRDKIGGLDLMASFNYYAKHGKLPPNAFVENLKKHRNHSAR